MAHHRHQSANRCPSRREGVPPCAPWGCPPLGWITIKRGTPRRFPVGGACHAFWGPGRPTLRCLPVDEPFEVLAHVRNISSLVERVGLLLERSSGVLGQPLLVVTTHNGIASCSASARTAGRRPSAGTTSTGTPRTSLSSRSNRPNVTRLDRGDRSTRMSTSLSGVSSPRATLPNTLTLEAPYFSAVASTCRRRCLRRRPSGGVGQPWTRVRGWLEPNVQPMAGGGDQSLECAERRLSTSGLVRTDDALGNMCPPSDVGLRQVGTSTCLSKQRTRGAGCDDSMSYSL